MENPNIIVVEDERGLADLYQSWLEEEYGDVNVAYTGGDALDKIDHETDIVFLDRRIPDLSGDEVLERVREQGFSGWVVMVTAVDPTTEIIEMDFDAYLPKPVEKEDLVTLVETVQTRADYNTKVREYTATITKIQTLQEAIDDERIDESEFYHELQKYADELRQEIEETVDDIEDVMVTPDDIPAA